MKHLFLTLNLMLFIGTSTAAAEGVKSNCSWKPPKPTSAAELQDISASARVGASTSEDSKFLVQVKERVYMHSLPHPSCKGAVFIVHRDQVSGIDYFPDRSGGFTEYARVSYYSKSMKKDVIGWVEMSKLCRLNLNGHCPANGLTPKDN